MPPKRQRKASDGGSSTAKKSKKSKKSKQTTAKLKGGAVRTRLHDYKELPVYVSITTVLEGYTQKSPQLNPEVVADHIDVGYKISSNNWLTLDTSSELSDVQDAVATYLERKNSDRDDSGLEIDYKLQDKDDHKTIVLYSRLTVGGKSNRTKLVNESNLNEDLVNLYNEEADEWFYDSEEEDLHEDCDPADYVLLDLVVVQLRNAGTNAAVPATRISYSLAFHVQQSCPADAGGNAVKAPPGKSDEFTIFEVDVTDCVRQTGVHPRKLVATQVEDKYWGANGLRNSVLEFAKNNHNDAAHITWNSAMFGILSAKGTTCKKINGPEDLIAMFNSKTKATVEIFKNNDSDVHKVVVPLRVTFSEGDPPPSNEPNKILTKTDDVKPPKTLTKINNNHHNSNVVGNKSARSSYGPVFARLIEEFNNDDFSLHHGFDRKAAEQMARYKICCNSKNAKEFLENPCSAYCIAMLEAIDWSNAVMSEGILQPPKAVEPPAGKFEASSNSSNSTKEEKDPLAIAVLESAHVQVKGAVEVAKIQAASKTSDLVMTQFSTNAPNQYFKLCQDRQKILTLLGSVLKQLKRVMNHTPKTDSTPASWALKDPFPPNKLTPKTMGNCASGSDVAQFVPEMERIGDFLQELTSELNLPFSTAWTQDLLTSIDEDDEAEVMDLVNSWKAQDTSAQANDTAPGIYILINLIDDF